MEKRLMFPTVMFVLAGISFAFGGWQYLQARSVSLAAQQRLAFVISSIQRSDIAKAKKLELYAIIVKGLPSVPSVLGIDVSGSFASTGTGDSCASDSQRVVCRVLTSEQADASTMASVCGVCNPQ